MDILTDTPVTAPRIPARARLIPAMARGFLNRCPHCGQGLLFERFLKVRPECESCGLATGSHRADDLPPYLVIFLVGHLVGYLMLTFEMEYDVPLWLSLTLWPTLTLALAGGLMQPMKGAVVGLQYAFGMHGFDRLPRRQEQQTPPHTDGTHHGSADSPSAAARLGGV